MKVTLGGSVPIRNAIRLDYPVIECVRSLLPICDEVVICDCDSDDGTREMIELFASNEPKITIVNFPWTDPRGSNLWFCEFLNYSRQHLSTEHFIHLDADELIFEEDYQEILDRASRREVAFFKRLNFWRDPSHLIPEGVCCGTKVLRMAATNMVIPSDYPYEPANATVDKAVETNIRVAHYGFLRHREAFFKKAREVQRIWCNSYDPRLEKAEQYEGNWMTHDGVVPWKDQLPEYNGTHPEIIQQWLNERGWKL